MAQEITSIIELKCAKTNGPNINFPRLQNLIDMAGNFYTSGVLTIGTGAHEILTLSADQTTVGQCVIVNTDPTNYVEIGIDASGTFRPLIKLKAGQGCLFPSTTVAIYAKANTGACKVQFLLLEE